MAGDTIKDGRLVILEAQFLERLPAGVLAVRCCYLGCIVLVSNSRPTGKMRWHLFDGNPGVGNGEETKGSTDRVDFTSILTSKDSGLRPMQWITPQGGLKLLVQ